MVNTIPNTDFTFNNSTNNMHYKNTRFRFGQYGYELYTYFNDVLYSLYYIRTGICETIPVNKISKWCLCIDSTFLLVTFYDYQTLALKGYYFLNITENQRYLTLFQGYRYSDTNIGGINSPFYPYSSRTTISIVYNKLQPSISYWTIGTVRIYNNYSQQNALYGDDIILSQIRGNLVSDVPLYHPISNSKQGLFQEIIINNEKYRIIAPHIFAVKDDGFYKNYNPW